MCDLRTVPRKWLISSSSAHNPEMQRDAQFSFDLERYIRGLREFFIKNDKKAYITVMLTVYSF